MPDFPFALTDDHYRAGAISTFSVLGDVNATAPASVAWPVANLGIFIPFVLDRAVTVCKMVSGSGAATAGNYDMGIFSAGGKRLVSTGATARVTSTEQIVDVTDTRIGPGLFYLGMSSDGTGTHIMITPSGTSPVPLQKIRLSGIVQAASVYTLPTSVTFAAASTAVLIPSMAAYLLPY
jgi:hypothetical protein